MEQECLRILGFSVRPSEKELKSAYKRLIKQYHPDVTGGETSPEYTRIDTAYKYLTGKINYRQAEAILFPEKKNQRTTEYRHAYDSAAGQTSFEDEFFRNFYQQHSEEFDENGYYRHRYYTYDLSFLKYVPLILLFIFIIVMVLFFSFLRFLFTPLGFVLLAGYLIWRVFLRKAR